jgi:uncharacterized protein
MIRAVYIYTRTFIVNNKRALSILSISIIFSLFLVSLSSGNDKFPRPRGPVNDFAGIISSGYARTMDQVAREVLHKTGVSIVVVTVKSIGDNDTADYTNRLYEAWGIGTKGEDKGVLIFLALKERRIRIETGYGVEGILPDGLVGEVLDRYSIPYLQRGDYGKGLANAMAAVSAIIAKDAGVSLTGQPVIPAMKTPKERQRFNVFSLILFFIVMSLLLGTRQGRAMLPWILLMLMMGSRGGGGGFGGFSGGFGGFGGGMSGGGGAGRGF